jgi:hypothetical protein
VYADVQDLHQAVRPSLDRRLTENPASGFVSPHRRHVFASSMRPLLENPDGGRFFRDRPEPRIGSGFG